MFFLKKYKRKKIISKHQDFYFNYLNIKKHLLVKGEVIECIVESAVSNAFGSNYSVKSFLCEVQKTHLSKFNLKNDSDPNYEYVESDVFYKSLNSFSLKEIKENNNLDSIKKFAFFDITFC